MDYLNATLEDVPTITETIKVLQAVQLETGTVTRRTQAMIFRQLPQEVLAAVAQELGRSKALAALSGTVTK